MNRIVGENLKRSCENNRDHEHTILRFARLHGIGDSPCGGMLREGAPSPTSGLGEHGEQRRRLVHIDDTVEGVRLCCLEAGAKSETVTVAGPHLVTFRAVGRGSKASEAPAVGILLAVAQRQGG